MCGIYLMLLVAPPPVSHYPEPPATAKVGLAALGDDGSGWAFAAEHERRALENFGRRLAPLAEDDARGRADAWSKLGVEAAPSFTAQFARLFAASSTAEFDPAAAVPMFLGYAKSAHHGGMAADARLAAAGSAKESGQPELALKIVRAIEFPGRGELSDLADAFRLSDASLLRTSLGDHDGAVLAYLDSTPGPEYDRSVYQHYTAAADVLAMNLPDDRRRFLLLKGVTKAVGGHATVSQIEDVRKLAARLGNDEIARGLARLNVRYDPDSWQAARALEQLATDETAGAAEKREFDRSLLRHPRATRAAKLRAAERLGVPIAEIDFTPGAALEPAPDPLFADPR